MDTWSFDDLKRALCVLYPEDDALVELRIICKGGGALSGIFTSGDDIASYVSMHSGVAKGIYTCLNKITERRRDAWINELQADARGVSDDEITSRELLLIDIDVERTDKDSGTTDSEHEAAVALARDIRWCLNEEAWPEPLLASSGNGAHLLYRLPSLPNDERSTLLVKDILEALAKRFNRGALKIDTTVFNASRISKLYGSMVCKGADTPERPHRVARILECPAHLIPVPVCILDAYRVSNPVERPAVKALAAGVKGFSLSEFISRHSIHTGPPIPYKGDGYKWQLDACPFNAEHKRPDAVLFEYADGSKAFRCSHDSCRGNGWVEFRQHFEPEWRPFEQNRPPLTLARPVAASTTAPGPASPAVEQPAVDARTARETGDLLLRGNDDLNDAGNAIRVARYGDGGILYSPDEKSFYVWDGRRYRKSLMSAIKLAQGAMLKFVEQATPYDEYRKWAVRSLDMKRINAALDSLRPHVEVSHADLDAQPHLLNFLNGTVDLRSGVLSPHARRDRITKLIDHNYSPMAQCPAFLRAFSVVLPRPGMMEHMQRCLGYSVTGETREKVVFICHGATGDNGKTTLVETVRRLLPEYSCKILIDSLMAKAGGETSNTMSDLSDLKGARFASTSETESGQRISEGRLKRITQGSGVIKSCRKYENAMEFAETHKLWMDCNHLPVIKGSDNAIWRRMHTIPFDVQLRRDQIDYGLMDKLDAEAEGILAWLVQGAVRWYAEGLGAPDFVVAAREEWREDMDIVGPFLDQRCRVDHQDSDTWTAKSNLHAAYKCWADGQADQRHLSREGFFEYLTAKGFRDGKRTVKAKQYRAIIGIGLIGTQG